MRPNPRNEAHGIPLALIVLLVVAHVAFSGSRFAFALRAIALGASEAQVGAVLGVMMLVPMLLAIHIGRWADHRGPRLPTRLGFALLTAGTLLAGTTASLPLLYVASVLTGIGYMLAHIAIMPAVGRNAAPGRSAAAFSALAVGFSFSGMTGPLICGFVVDHAGLQEAFFLMAAFPVASAVMLAARPPEGAPAEPATAQARRALDLLRHPPLRRVFIVTALLSMAWDMFIFLVPLYGSSIGLNATSMGLIMGAFSAGTLAVRALLPVIHRRLGGWGTAGLSLLVTAVGYGVFTELHGLAALLPAAFVMGLGLGTGQPTSMTLLHDASPPSRVGEAVGMRSMLTSASQTFLPVASGSLGAVLGVTAVFWVTALALGAGAALAFRLGAKPPA